MDGQGPWNQWQVFFFRDSEEIPGLQIIADRVQFPRRCQYQTLSFIRRVDTHRAAYDHEVISMVWEVEIDHRRYVIKFVSCPS